MSNGWHHYKFGLIVTGEGEEAFLPKLFKSLVASSTHCSCSFTVIRRIGQLRPRQAPKRRISVTGTNKLILDKDAEKIGIPARQFLDNGGSFVLLVDDLERNFINNRQEVFSLYREALDVMLKGRKHLASVHFLVNMLEAYYFAHAAAINAVLGTNLQDDTKDVEEMGHPKNELKKLVAGFDEKVHGERILDYLDLDHVLSRPETCASLRVLFAWCVQRMELPFSPRYRLDSGAYDIVTGRQLA